MPQKRLSLKVEEPAPRVITVYGNNMNGAGPLTSRNGDTGWYMTCGHDPTDKSQICSDTGTISIQQVDSVTPGEQPCSGGFASYWVKYKIGTQVTLYQRVKKPPRL